MIKKVLHTSDWHIGRRLKEHDRFEEFQKFFTWLEDLINSENIDTLLVSGDIFDNTTPSIQAQNLYYSFLSKLAKSNSCRHVVIISGNHDSPAFLDAPSEILKLCKIHVIGQACSNPEDEVIILHDKDNQPELAVCAVPYLRDRDVRTMTALDNPADIGRSLIEGINKHYSKVFECAREFNNIPVIAMGHLFIQGGRTQPDDGVRSLYVGTAIELDINIFPDWLTYTALGHLHSPQFVMRKNIRYSGSPIAMGFGEAGQNKSVYILELDGKNLAEIKSVNIPEFQKLKRINGNMTEIFTELREIESRNEPIWLEVTYNGNEIVADLQEKLQDFTKEYKSAEILSVHNDSKIISQITDIPEGGLENVTPIDMLKLCFDANKTPDEQRKIFMPMYQEILRELGVY